MINVKRYAAFMMTAASTAILSGAALAEVEQSRFSLEEVVVTAQKRGENLQSIPLSLTAFSADFLEKSRVESFFDLKDRAPGMVYDEFSPGQPRIFIRGIGNTNRSSAVDSAVGVFVDEVYMGRPEMASIDFADIERVEILRGPQGTLFGRNVVGGAVSFHTRKPSEELFVKASATYGNYKRLETKAVVSGPLADNVFAKVSVSARQRDGYAYNESTNNDIEDEQFFGTRAALRFVPNDVLDIQLNADISRRRGTGNWWDLVREGPNSIGKSNSEPRRGFNHPDDGYSDIDNGGVSLHVNWDSGVGTLTSITAYRESDMAARANTTGLFVAELTDPNRFNYHHTLFIQEDVQRSKQFSQELRLASPSGQRLTWVGGLYYFHENVDHIRYTDYRFINFNSNNRSIFDASTKTDAFAVFANATFNVTDAFSVQGGLRWSYDKKDHTVTAGGVHFTPFRDGPLIVPGFTAPGKENWDALTPSLALNYQASDDLFLYASISRGFKSGGFNDTDINKVGAETAFNPEFAWNYEAGFKSEWFDRMARLNVSVFYLDYSDLQVTTLIQPDPNFPPFGITGNAGKAKVKGFEAEWTILPFDGMTLYGSYSYTHNKLSDLVVNNVDLAGNKLGRAPKHKIFAGASYTFPIGAGASATLRADYTHTSSFFSTIQNHPVELVPAADNVDASMLIELQDGRWGLELWGKNLTNELNMNTISEVPPSDGYTTYLPPRTYGITVHFRY